MNHTMSHQTPEFTSTMKSTGRIIALYPGAFRPPHAAHYAAVRYLLTRPDIDEIVVIISNRARLIPGTTLALDATIAQRIWRLFLGNLEKVRIEIASHTAVEHALKYFAHCQNGSSLLFCLGETDLKRGDDRFRKLGELERQYGVDANIIQAPTGAYSVRSADLRTALIEDDAGKSRFFSALPNHLTCQQREEIWAICQEGILELQTIVQAKIHAVMNRSNLGPIKKLSCSSSDKPDQVFRARLEDERVVFIKYAGDALGIEEWSGAHTLKPRERLSVERKVLKWLATHLNTDFEIPTVIHFEKKTWTLVLSEVCPHGSSLQDNLQRGIFDPVIASQACQFLRKCHTIPHAPVLWGTQEADQKHWKSILDLYTVALPSEKFSIDTFSNLKNLKLASEQVAQPCFLHLDFHPKNVLFRDGEIGVIDFERSSSWGDPALDLGMFLGHYVYWALNSSADNSWYTTIQTIVDTYQRGIGDSWPQMAPRAVAFAGATLCYILASKDLTRAYGSEHVIRAGEFLLTQCIEHDAKPDQILCKTLTFFTR